MIPIHVLLARIRWDPDFGRGRWEISYLDHARRELVRVPLENMRTQPGIRFVFDVVDEDGITHSIPYHRVRQAWRDGKLVWSRLVPSTPKRAAVSARSPQRRHRRRVDSRNGGLPDVIGRQSKGSSRGP